MLCKLWNLLPLVHFGAQFLVLHSPIWGKSALTQSHSFSSSEFSSVILCVIYTFFWLFSFLLRILCVCVRVCACTHSRVNSIFVAYAFNASHWTENLITNHVEADEIERQPEKWNCQFASAIFFFFLFFYSSKAHAHKIPNGVLLFLLLLFCLTQWQAYYCISIFSICLVHVDTIQCIHVMMKVYESFIYIYFFFILSIRSSCLCFVLLLHPIFYIFQQIHCHS